MSQEPLTGPADRKIHDQTSTKATENSNMPQEISLKRGKQENNSLALFTDISQESPVIRNAVAQSMTSSSLLFLTPLFFYFFVGRSHTVTIPLFCFHVSPPLPAAMHSGGGGVSAGTGRNTENDSTHDITTLLCQVFS